MKIILYSVLLAVLSFTLFSCSNTSNPITGIYNASEMYDYTIQASTVPNAVFIITQNKTTYYISTSDAKLYKVTNGTAEEFLVNSSVFKTYYVSVYDNTYMVFIGARVSDNKVQYMIYDNGTYTIHDSPIELNVLGVPYIPERGTFYVARYDSSYCYKFKNGVYTSYTFPGRHNVELGKSGGNVYCISTDSTHTRHIFKMTESGPTLLRTEPYVGAIHSLNNCITRIENATKKLSLFTESGWTDLFTVSYTTPGFYGYVKGTESNNIDIYDIDSANKITVTHWDGTALTKQTNIPSEAVTTGVDQYNAGNYISNSNYFFFRNAPQKVMRMSLK